MEAMRIATIAAVISLLSAGCGGSGSANAGSGGNAGGSGANGGASAGGGSSSGGAGQGGAAATGSGGGGASACAKKTLGPGDTDETLSFGGQSRTFHVHAPATYDHATPTELVLVFHGYLESDSDIANVTKMTDKSDAHGFIVVYPQGLNDSWNAGACCGNSASAGVDDVGFVGALLDHLESEYCIDEKHVHAAGFSNGGMLSQRLGCEMSDRIASIGPVAGPLAVDSCMPGRAVPVLEVHGKSDPIVPYGGGGLSGTKSVDDTIAFWVMNDGCTDAAPAQVYMNGDATCSRYSMCDAGSAVELCTISDGGHQWPGGNDAGFGLGTLSMDLDASETIVKFFADHPLP
jgi:polyhydroxybutyrate depolymerase